MVSPPPAAEHSTGFSNVLSAGHVFSQQREKKEQSEFLYASLPTRRAHHGCLCVCVIFPNVLCVHPCNSSVPVPNRDPSPACASSYPLNAQPIHPAPAKIPNSPSPPAQMQRKEQESKWNEWVSQYELAWAKWKCQARHRSPLSACSGSCLAGEHKQNDAKPVTVNTSPASILSHSSLLSWERKRGATEKKERVDDTRRGIMCRICSESSSGYSEEVRA